VELEKGSTQLFMYLTIWSGRKPTPGKGKQPGQKPLSLYVFVFRMKASVTTVSSTREREFSVGNMVVFS
jgi:hypothetical protein